MQDMTDAKNENTGDGFFRDFLPEVNRSTTSTKMADFNRQ